MKCQKDHDNNVFVQSGKYSLKFDASKGVCAIGLKNSERKLLDFDVYSTVDTLSQKEVPSRLILKAIEEGEAVKLVFESASSIWDRKLYIVECEEETICYSLKISGCNERVDRINYFLSRNEGETGARAGFTRVYAPRFDWSAGKVYLKPEDSDSLGCQQWLSPPPFCYAFEAGAEWVGCGLAVRPGEYNFLSYDYHGGSSFYLSVAYEGHTIVNGEFESPGITLVFGAREGNAAVKAYIDYLSAKNYMEIKEKNIPAWWREPIFCGWGQQRHDYRKDHEGHENGNFRNVGDYSREDIYRTYVDIMNSKKVCPGTIIIDFKWAEAGALAKPCPGKWKNMRGFIDEQHENGKKVLLWYAPLLADGLPEEACMKLDGRIIAADPTSPAYKEIMQEEIRKMVSPEPDCLNADGLKIDFTQNLPSEYGAFRNYLSNGWSLLSEDEKYVYPELSRRKSLINTFQNIWGVELLKAYLSVIYERMKEVKPDSMLIAHTANPYFANVVDVLRLNDLDGTSPDVEGIMTNRAEIAAICNPHWLIDTDNDLMMDKEMWRKYIKLQPKLGIPDTYYISAIAMSGEEFEQADYDLLNKVWEEYRKEYSTT